MSEENPKSTNTPGVANPADETVSPSKSPTDKPTAPSREGGTPADHGKHIHGYTPVQLWAIINDLPLADPEDPDQQLEYATQLAIAGQVFRHSLHPCNAKYNLPTYAPVLFPEVTDIKNMTNTAARKIPLPDFWTPDATPEQIVQGAAKDLAILSSVLAARAVNSTGFQADSDTIKQFTELASGLRNVTYILRETKPRRGRPPASSTPIKTGQNKRRRKHQPAEPGASAELQDPAE